MYRTLVVPPGDISIFAVQKLWISGLFSHSHGTVALPSFTTNHPICAPHPPFCLSMKKFLSYLYSLKRVHVHVYSLIKVTIIMSYFISHLIPFVASSNVIFIFKFKIRIMKTANIRICMSVKLNN